MADYLVTPTHKHGYQAPSILVRSELKGEHGFKDASENAKELSRLSDFKEWDFKDYVRKLKRRQVFNSKGKRNG